MYVRPSLLCVWILFFWLVSCSVISCFGNDNDALVTQSLLLLVLFLRLLYYRYCNDSLTNTNEREVCLGSDAADFASLLFGSFAFRNSNFDLDFGRDLSFYLGY